jgi:hypothetical protein
VDWMVARARRDRFFLGKALSDYQASNHIDDTALAAELRCAPAALSRLVLCRWPDDRGSQFAQEVRTIAAFASCDADALIRVLRQVATMRAFQQPSMSSTDGMLMAARDRHEAPEDGKPKRKRTSARKRRRPPE